MIKFEHGRFIFNAGILKIIACEGRGPETGAVSVRFTVLGSGSAGNCSLLETPSARILIDAGFSGRQIRSRLEKIRSSHEGIDAVLVTHEHSDHTRGLNVIGGKWQVPVFANRMTREAIESGLKAEVSWKQFSSGDSFFIGDVEVESFCLPHDAHDPVGFLLKTPGGTIGILTDLGHSNPLVLQKARESDVLLLETNYDNEMLKADVKRPWQTKQRIMSRHGHLSNDQAAELLGEIGCERLKHLFLGHLSRDCNTTELAVATVEGRLSGMGMSHIPVECLCQETPGSTVTLEILQSPQQTEGGQLVLF